MGLLWTLRRDLLRRGSPAFKVGVWVAGIAGGLFWIYLDEREKPVKERAVFLPARREVQMEEGEIREWNLRLSGGKLLPHKDGNQKQEQEQQQEQHQGLEAARNAALAAIKEQGLKQESAEKQQQQKQQGWFSSLLGLGDKAQNPKAKKVPLFFDK
ncbi:hypothetical protein, conserved [Eimeria maxima]|uniref:Uncharacterized protein n=1 Tax=Eimeria maxima TaxID=5804 RepID=U6LZZ0_EIMMA|nr:hypothetical protein, conserved [Eimeria maxima]CDJ57321.1 hypothetical protein, conserved [Eimeria maxima]